MHPRMTDRQGKKNTGDVGISKDWKETGTSREELYNKVRMIKDPVHGTIELNDLLVKIIDTPQFQRLRYIKQVGGGYYVYPGAAHNRFEHSIGTAHLAGELLSSIKEKQPDLDITDKDILCVEIAGLCHDLGHGPFSHVFDRSFIPKARPDLKGKIEHEDLSLKMFDHMIAENGLNDDFQKYGLDETDKNFIKEMIKPNKIESKWTHKGRGKDKSYLYEVISNKATGVDVDKWDYFARDCYQLGWSNNFDYKRCVKEARVIKNGSIRHICFRDKEVHNMYDMFYTRYCLHRRAYQHKTVKIIEHMIVEAMLNADDFIKIPGKDGSSLKMSQAVDDMYAYTNMTDNVFQRILCSTEQHSKLKKARNILQAVERRNIYKLAGEESLPKILHDLPIDDVDKVATEISSLCKPKIDKSNIIVQFVTFDYGKRKTNPIDRLFFYEKTDPDTVFLIPKQQVSKILPVVFTERKLRAYLKRGDMKDRDNVKNALEKWCDKQAKRKRRRKRPY